MKAKKNERIEATDKKALEIMNYILEIGKTTLRGWQGF